MTKLEKLYSIIENSREVGVKLNKEVLQQVEHKEGSKRGKLIERISKDGETYFNDWSSRNH